MGRTILQEREGERAGRGSTYLALVCKRTRSDAASRTDTSTISCGWADIAKIYIIEAGQRIFQFTALVM